MPVKPHKIKVFGVVQYLKRYNRVVQNQSGHTSGNSKIHSDKARKAHKCEIFQKVVQVVQNADMVGGYENSFVIIIVLSFIKIFYLTSDIMACY